MNCPNCDRTPSSLIHNLKAGGVGFKKAVEGFLKCQHCGQILKHKRHFKTFIAFEKRYYLYFFLLFTFFVAAFYSAFTLIETQFASVPGNSAAFLHLVVLGVITISFLITLTTLSLKYALYEMSNESELMNQEEVQTKYQLLFLTYFLGALLSGIFIFYLIDAYSPNFEAFLTIVSGYLIVIIGLGYWIVGKSAPESNKEAAVVYSNDDSHDKPV